MKGLNNMKISQVLDLIWTVSGTITIVDKNEEVCETSNNLKKYYSHLLDKEVYSILGNGSTMYIRVKGE
jgi:hypothetical protein